MAQHPLKVVKGLATLPGQQNLEVATLPWGGHLMQEA